MKKISYHIFLWVFILLYVFDYFVDSFDGLWSIIYTLFEAITYATEFYVNLLVLIPFLLAKKRIGLYFLSVVLMMSIFFSIYYFSGLYVDLLASDPARAALSFSLNHSLFIILSYLTWYFVGFSREREKRLQMEYEKLQLEMKLLKSQISPHFLFNALNNIYSLTLTKNDNAPKMIDSLSNLLRYFIYEGSKKYVPLSQEIKAIESYISIQRLRKIPGEANVKLELYGDVEDVFISPLLIINLIENAFKHGDIAESKNGYIQIIISVKNKKIEIFVENSTQNKLPTKGIGLKNMQSQLNILFGDKYYLSIEEKENIYRVKLEFDGI